MNSDWRFNQYSDYTKTDLPWLGNVPSHWEVARIKFVAQLESGHTPSRNNSEYWDGDIPWFSLADIKKIREKNQKYIYETEENITQEGVDNSGARVLPKDTVVLSRTASVGYACLLGTPAATDQSMVNWICGSDIESEYLYYVFESMGQEFDRLARGSTHETIYMPDMEKLSTPLPPLNEQDRIVSFLNKYVSKIDEIIDNKRQLLELLTEKKYAILDDIYNQANNMNLTKMKYLADFLPGYAFSSDEFINKEEIKLLRGTNVGVGEVNWDDVVYWPKSELQDYKKYLLEPGDLVLGMDRPWISDGIRIARIDESDCPALLVQRVLRIRAKSDVQQEYLQMMLVSDRFRQYFEPITTGVSVPHISQEQVGEFEVPLPSKTQQSSVLTDWKQFKQTHDRLNDTLNKSIYLLEENRKALITKAVTGGIDLTEWK